jgi:hypothetical protein
MKLDWGILSSCFNPVFIIKLSVTSFGISICAMIFSVVAFINLINLDEVLSTTKASYSFLLKCCHRLV